MTQIVCTKCVMDRSANDIFFDKNGVCNFCHQAQRALKEIEIEKPNFEKRIKRIKKDGRGRRYNCLLGLSGGADSSTALHCAVQFGLRPLCFTMDNGWNDPKADSNIMNLVEMLKVPLYRYIIDLQKFKELQGAFMRGGVKNLEAITDHILFAATYEMAVKNSIKWVISGGNVNSESVMPISWGEDPRDLYWITSIYKKMTGKKLKGLPTLSLWKEQYYRLIKQIKFFQILNYVNYNREEAIKLLQEKYHYEPYGEKHCENVFTWWYQNFYLFTKWGIDKRKAHYSSLINSGQLDRKIAMQLLTRSPVYPKLGIEERALKYPKKSYYDYQNSEWIRRFVIMIYKYLPKSWKS